MKPYALALAASTALLVTLAHERPAHALGPIDLEIAAKVGYGTNANDVLGVGLGGRAGVSFFGLYGGVSAIDYLGKSVNGVSVHSFLYGAEVGWGFKISLVTIRPLVGFGDAVLSVSLPATALDPNANLSGSVNSFYLEPGGLVQLNFGLLIVGVDAGCLILTNGYDASGGASTTTEAFTIHGQVGVKF
jgi:hypothetical protein